MVQISKERFALGSYQYLRYPFEYFLDTAVLLGMQNVELWAAGPSFCLDTMDEAQLIEKAAQIRSRELSVCCITPEQCQYPVNLAAEDEKIREYSIRNFERAFYAAEILNCPKVLVSAGCGYFNKPVEDAWKRSEESLYRLSEKAQKMGILLVLETLTPLSSNVLNTPEQQKEMISLMPSGSMKPMLDIGQMVYMDQNYHIFISMIPTRRFTWPLGMGIFPSVNIWIFLNQLDIRECMRWSRMIRGIALIQGRQIYRA